MAKQRLTVELDEETVRSLAVLGRPIEVLAHLASSAAAGVRHPDHPKREQTDKSLRVERDKSDVLGEQARKADEEEAREEVRRAREQADHELQTARERADHLLQTAGNDAGRELRPSTGTEANAERARTVLEGERATADELLEHERARRSRDRTDTLASARHSTDRDLGSERSHTDALVIDQREANAQMVRATIRAQEQTDEAEAAKTRAEENERTLRTVAEFREMFIGMLGHDLRNPLGAIITTAALLLRRGHLDEQDAATTTRIIRSGQRMVRMIAQLLDLTRARLGGGLPIEAQPADLGEICRNVVEEFEVTIQLELEGDLTGTWDQDRLAEVLSNLTGNAIEYAAPETAVIVNAHADGPEVVVEIVNQGKPIPADVLPFIFAPFRRAKQREKSTTGNLGLGLYIAHQIVLSHGGTLDARSANGTTTFVMRLPRSPAIPHT